MIIECALKYSFRLVEVSITGDRPLQELAPVDKYLRERARIIYVQNSLKPMH